jgi:hypothetical protein
MDDVAMQDRCVHCLREQYMPAVLGISTGDDSCRWCGEKSYQMSVAEYQAALRARLGIIES